MSSIPNDIQILAVPVSLVALSVSFLALIFLSISVLRKTGLKLRANLSECSHHACNDKYFSEVTVENLKDKSVVIFAIYVRFGYNYYLEIDSFEEKPLILKPYEAFTKSYEPLDFYSAGMKRIKLERLFENNVKRTIVLSTSEGKYLVKPKSKRWSPYSAFFRNAFTAIISPVRSTYKGVSYGENALFIVELTFENENDYIFALYPYDHRYRRFKKFMFTQKSLSAVSELKNFINQQRHNGNIVFKDLKIHDVQDWSKHNQKHKNEIIEAIQISWFDFYVKGRIIAKLDDLRITRINKRKDKKHTDFRANNLSEEEPSRNKREPIVKHDESFISPLQAEAPK